MYWSQKAGRFLIIKRTEFFLDNLINGEQGTSRAGEGENEGIKEIKGRRHAVGVTLAEKSYWHASLLLSQHSKTHTHFHTVTQWARGYSSTCHS